MTHVFLSRDSLLLLSVSLFLTTTCVELDIVIDLSWFALPLSLDSDSIDFDDVASAAANAPATFLLANGRDEVTAAAAADSNVVAGFVRNNSYTLPIVSTSSSLLLLSLLLLMFGDVRGSGTTGSTNDRLHYFVAAYTYYSGK